MRHSVLGFALLAGTALASQAAAETPFTPEDVMKLKNVGSIAMSPDGSHVAYTLSRTRDILGGEENGSSKSEVRIATAAGESTVYLSESMGAYGIDWLDETTLTFLAKGPEDDNTALYSVNVGGGAPEKVFSWDEGIRSYDFADDGDVLFFSATEAADPKDKALEKKGFDANIIDEDFHFTHLYRADLDAGETGMLEIEGQVSAFDASPDGSRVVVALADTPLVGDDIINRKFHIVDGDNGRIQSVIETEGKIGKAAFSADGRRIAFLAGQDRHDPVAHTLAVANARNGEWSFLTKDDTGDQLPHVRSYGNFLELGRLRTVRFRTAT